MNHDEPQCPECKPGDTCNPVDAARLASKSSKQYLLEADAAWLEKLAGEFPHPILIAADLRDLAARIRQQIGAGETSRKPARDADHCDYPDCEQHWTYVATEQRKLLSEARAYVLSFASITKHPTAPADAHDLVKRMDAWIKNSPPAVDFRAAPPPETSAPRDLLQAAWNKYGRHLHDCQRYGMKDWKR